MTRLAPRSPIPPVIGVAAMLLLAPAASAGELVTFPNAKVTVFKDADCFDKAGEVVTATLEKPTRESPGDAACVKIKAGTKIYYVLPASIKPPLGCTGAKKVATGPQATTYGSSGASACPRN